MKAAFPPGEGTCIPWARGKPDPATGELQGILDLRGKMCPVLGQVSVGDVAPPKALKARRKVSIDGKEKARQQFKLFEGQ